MAGGVRYDWIDCVCCAAAKCCRLHSNEGVPFAPAEGFTLESIEVTNPNPDGCVGRAKVDVQLSQPADPGMGCQSGTCNGVSKCNGMPADVAAEFQAEMRALFESLGYEWTDNYQGYGFVGFPAGGELPPELADCAKGGISFNSNSVNVTCEVTCTGQTNMKKKGLFKRTVNSGPLGCMSSTQVLAWCRNTYLAPDIAAVNAALQAAPIKLVRTRNGYECEYWMFGCVDAGQTLSACYQCHQAGCYYIDNIVWFSTPSFLMLWGLRCSQEPCAMPDYDWPLMLPCVCTGEFEKPGVTQTPDCKLYLDTTSRGYGADKCLFNATYKGVIAAGQIECPPGTTDPDCRCCGED